MTKKLISYDDEAEGLGLPDVVEQRLDARYSGSSSGGVGVSLETDTGYPSRPDTPLVIWRGATDPRELPAFVVGVDLWAQTTPGGGGEEEPQVTWFTDFSTDAVGIIPAGWSVDWMQESVVATIADDEDKNVFRVGRSDLESPGLSFIRWHDIPEVEDVEMVVRWRGLDDTEAAQYFPTAVRASGTFDEPYAYASGTSRSDKASLRSYVGTRSTRTVVPDTDYTYVVDQWQWTRLRIEGAMLTTRSWADGEAEPSEWDVSASDTQISGVGGVGILVTYLNRTMDISQVGVGIDGATAPVSA